MAIKDMQEIKLKQKEVQYESEMAGACVFFNYF